MARPRDVHLDELILDAAASLLHDGGYAAVTMEEVALRAGASRPSVYRRWPTRTHLAFELIMREMLLAPEPHTGDVRADLVRSVTADAALFRSLDRMLMADLLSTMITDEQFATEVDRRFLQVGLEQVAQILFAAGDTMDARRRADVFERLENLGGALIYRTFVLHRDIDAAAVQRLVDALLH